MLIIAVVAGLNSTQYRDITQENPLSERQPPPTKTTRSTPAPTNTPSPEQLYEKGLDIYTGTFSSILSQQAALLFVDAARLGHRPSMERLAWMFANGIGVPKNLDAAVTYFTEATHTATEEEKKEILDRFLDGYRERETPEGNANILDWLKRLAATGDEYFVQFLANHEEESVIAHFDSGVYAYETGNFAAAFDLFHTLAEQGNIAAQFNLGVMLSKGAAGKKNDVQAMKWYQRAADEGSADAQIQVGLGYYKGRGVKQSYATAARWFRIAAEQGDASGQALLGSMYDSGLGLKKNRSEAVTWYRRAAEQGHAKAQHLLALSYAHGLGVPINYPLAYKWWSLALAADPNVSEREQVKFAALRAKMTGEQIAEGQKLAAAFVPKAAPAADGFNARRSLLDLEGVSVMPAENSEEKSTISVGTGFFIDSAGHLLTAYHVVGTASRLKVRLGNALVTASLVASDPGNDIAVLKAEMQPTHWLQCAPNSRLKLGQPVFTIGFPNTDIQGLEPKFSDGKIGALSGLGDDPRHLQTSIPATNGNSGGPLVDSEGRVVGLVVQKLNDIAMLKHSGNTGQGISFALKAAYFRSILPSSVTVGSSHYDAPSGQLDPNVIEMARRAVALVVAE